MQQNQLSLCQYPDGIFKIPDFLGWNVVVNGPNLIGEYRKLPEKVFSSRIAFESVRSFRPCFFFPPLPRYTHIKDVFE